jgi:hypothetical protein
MINLYKLPTPEPMYSVESGSVYIANAFNSMIQDLSITDPVVLPAGSEPFQYTNRYGGTSYYLYGPNSDSADKLTE